MYFNKNAQLVLGYSDEDFYQNTPALYSTNFLDSNSIIKTLEPLLEGRESFIELKTNYKNNNNLFMPVNVKYFLSEYNNEPVIISLASDISYKNKQQIYSKDTSKLLQQFVLQKKKDIVNEKESRLYAIINNLPFPIWLMDDKLNYIQVNRQFLDDFDKTFNDVINKTNYNLWEKDLADSLTLIDKEVFASGNTSRIEEIFSIHDQMICVETYRIPIRDVDNNIIGLLGFRIDKTENKKLENEYVIARELAESANQLKSEFLAMMSHEIRTPLTCVVGFLQMLSMTELNEMQKDYLTKVQNSSNILLKIINDVLDFSKIEADKIIIENVDFNLYDLLKEIFNLAFSNIHLKGLDINLLIQSSVPQYIKGDPDRLRQILTNLINNSLKFTDSGEILLTVKNLPDKNEKVNIFFEIMDTGRGINEEFKQKVLEPFTQEDASLTKQYAGTGLGLAICDRLIKLMNGNIHIDSELNRGTKISFILEFNKSDKIPDKISKFTDIKLLVFDKNKRSIEIIKYYLNQLEVNLFEAATIDEIIPVLNKNKDINIIIASNLEDSLLLNNLKSADMLNNLTIIPVFTYIDNSQQNLLDEWHLKEFLIKPFTIFDLIQLMQFIVLPQKTQKVDIKKKIIPQYKDQGTKPKMLIVEDNDMNIELITDILQSMRPFEVEYTNAYNGVQAIEAFKNNKFDLILMDCQMPVMDGFQATKEIRKLENDENKGNHVTIIAFTAYAMLEDIQKSKEAGMDDYITKPFDIIHFINLIKKYLIKEKTGVNN